MMDAGLWQSMPVTLDPFVPEGTIYKVGNGFVMHGSTRLRGRKKKAQARQEQRAEAMAHPRLPPCPRVGQAQGAGEP